MNAIHKTSAISFYLITSGFQTFKNRIQEELSAVSGASLMDILDDKELLQYYRRGESADFVVSRICGVEEDWDEDLADVG